MSLSEICETLIEQVSPVPGLGVSVRTTTPLNPCRPVTVMLARPWVPAGTVSPVGAAVTRKSWIMKLTTVE